MVPFTTMTGLVAPLPFDDIDTDAIIPARFMKTIRREGLRTGVFHALAHTPAGTLDPNFILNRPPFDHATLLLAGRNFGTGSSREHAVWALADFGIRCIIAPSFADIFYGNAVKNGLLPAIVEPAVWTRLVEYAGTATGLTLTVDLIQRTVTPAGGEAVAFDITTNRRDALLHGLDDIARTLVRGREIDAWEARAAQKAAALDVPNEHNNAKNDETLGRFPVN